MLEELINTYMYIPSYIKTQEKKNKYIKKI